MRILIVSKFFPPENSVASLRPYSWAKFWSRAGHDVSVLTTLKLSGKAYDLKVSAKENYQLVEVDYSSIFYKLQDLYLGKLKGEDKNSNTLLSPTDTEVTVKKHLAFSVKDTLKKINSFRLNRGLLTGQRMPDTMDLWIKPALHWARANGPWDLVVSSHAPYACHVIAYYLKKEQVAQQWIADFRDLWTDHHNFKGLFPFTLIEKLLEKRLMKQPDAITTVSKPLASVLSAKYGNQKVHVIENGFDPEDLSSISTKPIFTDNKIRIVYTGTIYKGKQDLTPLFKAVANIAEDPTKKYLLEKLEILFIGATNHIALESASKAKILPWVKDGGFLPREDILRMQRDAHALLFLEFDGRRVKGILTGKLFEYLYSTTEIWGVGVVQDSCTGDIIRKANAGISFGDDTCYIVQELLRLLTQPNKEKLLVNKSILDKYDRQLLALNMLKIVTFK